MTHNHEFNQDVASAAWAALAQGCDTEALLLALLAIADRLADLTEVLAAATQTDGHDGEPIAPRRVGDGH